MTTNYIASALRSNGYYLDTTKNILYMTAPYEKKSNIYGTQEYKLVCDILARFPGVQISIQKKARKNTTTYEMMKEFIKIMPDSETMLKEFERVQLMSHAYSSPYKYVENWFGKKYPFYGKYQAKDEAGNIVWDMVELYKLADEQKMQDAEKAAAAEQAAVADPAEAPNRKLLVTA